MFGHPDFDDHEEVVFASDPRVGLRAIIAIHSTALGPAFGGCRMWRYASEADALADVLRLARGMTYKAAICDLPYGGGKSVVLADPRTEKTPQLLRAMGRVVDDLNGRYIIADDVGTTLADLAVMRQVTAHSAAATTAAQAPLPVTAFGVFQAIRAAAAHRLGRDDLDGVRVAVQGLGNVGMPLCRYLHEAGAWLAVADVDADRSAAAAHEFGAVEVPAGAIYTHAVDVFAPCALGGVLNRRTIPQLATLVVCGGANNQLADDGCDVRLADRGILYVPDYVGNAGGVIDFHQERIDDRPAAVMAAVGRLREITQGILERAASERRTPREVADRIVHDRLAAARGRQATAPRSPG